jgi:Protein of unknown function (DUF3619)
MNQESQEDSAFEKRSRELLEESKARLDGRTLSRLTQARHAALGQLQRPARRGWHTFVPAGAAAAAVLAVVMWVGRTGPEAQVARLAANPNALDDMDLLGDTDAPDFVDDGEDLEFYEWAAGELET